MFLPPKYFSVAPVEIRASNIFCVPLLFYRSMSIHEEYIPKYTWSRNDVGSPRSTSFISFLIIHAYRQEQALFPTNKQASNSVLCSFSVPVELFQNVFPKFISQVGGCTDSFQQKPKGRHCLTKMLATCVVEDVSKYLYILTLEFSVVLQRLSFLFECKLILLRLLDADEPCSVNTADEPEWSF